MKIFITGESGTIPMSIQELALNEYNIDVVNTQLEDNFLTHYKAHQSFKIRKREIDFLDRKLLFSELMIENVWKKIDVIIHSGAFVGTDYCESNPNLAIETNVAGTQNIVEICNKFDIKLVYLSTTAIFDPKQYDKNNPITESTKINPQTIYGITKYAGELIVKRLCKTPYLILRPVFGFGDYPHDLHSALTKVIYVLNRNYMKNDVKKLKVLLDKKINKSYTRVENISRCIIELLLYSIESSTWREEYNIGENHKYSLNWYDLLDIIFDNNKMITYRPNDIEFIFNEDYLHWHNINDEKLADIKLDFQSLKGYIDIEDGITFTNNSVIKNIDETPYWI